MIDQKHQKSEREDDQDSAHNTSRYAESNASEIEYVNDALLRRLRSWKADIHIN